MGIDHYAVRYEKEREAANRSALGAAPAAVRQALQALAGQLERWSDERIYLCGAFYGGGTAYTHQGVREKAALADVVAAR